VGISQPRGKFVVKETESTALKVKHRFQQTGIDCPVLLAAQGPKMIEASKTTDGVLLNYSDVELADWAFTHYDETGNDFLMGLFPPTHLSPEARPGHRAIRYAASLVALGLTEGLQRKFGIYDELKPANRKMAEHGLVTREVTDLISAETLARFGLSFTDAQLCDYMSKVADIGYDLVVLGPPLCMDSEGIRYLAQARRRCS
jgi:hypothetical protein